MKLKSIRGALLLILVALVGGVVGASLPAQAGQTGRRFLAFYEPGSNWDYGRDYRTQPGFSQHIAYLRKQTKAGVRLAGDIQGKKLGIVVPEPSMGKAALLKIAEGSPLVKKGVFKVEVRAFILDVQGEFGAGEAAPEGGGFDEGEGLE